MPFRERCPVQERIALFLDYDTGVYTVEELTQRYGVSRETFYVWKRRRESGAEDCTRSFRAHRTAVRMRHRKNSSHQSSRCAGSFRALVRRR